MQRRLTTGKGAAAEHEMLTGPEGWTGMEATSPTIAVLFYMSCPTNLS